MSASESQRLKEVYEFGPFRVDAEKEVLSRSGEPVPLTPKTFQILLVLLRHPKETVTKDELMKAVWPDTFVEEANLSRNIFMLRKALGESPQEHQYILTVPGRGYRLAESVRLLPAQEISIVAANHSKVQVQVKETKPWAWIAAAIFVALVLAIGAIRFLSHRSTVLSEKDTVVVADFANTTGDSAFDDTLRQGLTVQLEQSPFLCTLTDERVQRTLSRMGQPPDARLTPKIAREVCERTGSTAVLDGSIALLGSEYVLGLRATDCRTGSVLAEEQLRAVKKEDVLNALTQIASRFRSRLGEPLGSVRQHDIPLEDASSSSLEALRMYSAARKLKYSPDGYSAVIPLLKRAIEVDPKFAMAHAFLGRTYGDIGESLLSAESTSKAYQFRDHASERERFFIEATYDRQVTGNLEKARQTMKSWVQMYRRDRDAHGMLSGFASQGVGRYQEAVEEGKDAIAIDPDFVPAYDNTASAYVYLDRPEEAETILREASARKLEAPDFILLRYHIAFLKGDKEAMEREGELGKSIPGAEDWMLHAQALTSAYFGKAGQARQMSQRATDLARQSGQRERAAMFETGQAVWEAFFENALAARRKAKEAMELSNGRDVEYGTALALALTKDSYRAEDLANDLERLFPEDTCVRFSYLPTLRAALSLNRGQPSQAIDLLQAAVPNETAVPRTDYYFYFGGLYSAFVRGEAYLAAKRGTEAAAEFQKILDHPGIVLGDPIAALAHVQLGRAYALAGDAAKARAAYQDFLTLWKDADPDVPILKQAKAEYAKLE